MIMKNKGWMKMLPAVLMTALLALSGCGNTGTQFVYTSDAHYGISRAGFQGASNVDSQVVNAAMVSNINSLATVTLPCDDNGIKACTPVGDIDFVVETGDVANRSELLTAATATMPAVYIQSAAASWSQFERDYIDGLTLKDKFGKKVPLYLVPGNHDVSNAIGFYKPMSPLIDATSVAEIYNRMLKPATTRTKDTYNYAVDKVYYSKNVNCVRYRDKDYNCVHLVFINMWPDSAARAWMETDLKQVDPGTPVLLFTHDQPDIETKHLTNPNGSHDINARDKFENLVTDISSSPTTTGSSTVEQRNLVTFLKAHRNIVAYFHGNSNWNQFYTYTGPDNDISLTTFRVDSPMKGSSSAVDETKLSYQVVSIDAASKNMTVREYLWNLNSWGTSTTVSLAPRTR